MRNECRWIASEGKMQLLEYKNEFGELVSPSEVLGIYCEVKDGFWVIRVLDLMPIEAPELFKASGPLDEVMRAFDTWLTDNLIVRRGHGGHQGKLAKQWRRYDRAMKRSTAK